MPRPIMCIIIGGGGYGMPGGCCPGMGIGGIPGYPGGPPRPYIGGRFDVRNEGRRKARSAREVEP